jgi:hypothetical protein
MVSKRDEFPAATKRVLASRVGTRCSNADCQRTTSGPNSDPEKAINIGVAAHITAAAPGGPRYDAGLSEEERKSAQNGIWLCQTCAKLIDNDAERYPSELLREWKRGAEERALASVSGATSTLGEVGLSSSAALLAGEVDRLAAQMSEAVDQDLERMISAWREGRTGETLGWLRELKGDETRWRALTPRLKARLLRFEASIGLNATRDTERAKELADEARALAPLENDARLWAVIAYVESGPEAAIELLAEERDVDSLNLKARLILETNRAERAEECRAVLDFDGTDLEPDAETFRLRALSYLVSKDLDRAQLEVQKATELGGRWESVRLAAAMIDYLSSLSPAALPDSGAVAWPEPVDWHLVRRDDDSLTRLRGAARVFEELTASAEDPEEKRMLQAWRLACLANDPERQVEVRDYCRTILEADPTHYRAVMWAVARGIDVDLGPTEAALRDLVAEGSAEYAHVLALTCRYFASGRADKAVELLDETKLVFEEIRADTLWTFWRVQALTLSGNARAAVELLDDSERGTQDALREVRTVALRALAEEEDDWEPLMRHLESSYEETGDPTFLAGCCELKAQRQDWAYVADRAEELIEKIGTDEAVRLAAIAAYQDDRFRLCLRLLDEHRALFARRKLPDDLRRVQTFCRSAVGVLPEAIAEAEALVNESPTTPNMLALARLYFAEGDLKSLAVISRRLNDAPDLSPEHRLELSRLVQLEDHRLAASLWRNAISDSLPDSLVSAAVSLGFQLNLEEELGALMARMGELASRGEGGMELRNAADIFPFFEAHQRQMAELEELYRGGKAPIHIITEQANRPLSEFYRGVLSKNEGSPAPLVQPPLFVRHGGRGPTSGFSDTLTGRRLNLDVTAVLLAAHLEILPAVEQAFGPLRSPADLIPALLLMAEKTAHHQPSTIEAYRRIVELAEGGSLRVVDPELRPEHDARLVEELGEHWVAAFERAREEDGFLLDFLPLIKIDLSGPPSTLPEDAEERLVNCRSVLEVLRQRGQLSDGEYSRALSRLGEEGRKEPSSATPREGSVLYCDGSTVELLAGAGLLRAACGLFRVCVERRELDEARASLRYQEYARGQIEWLNGLIDRLRSGVEDGTYEIIPVPPREDERQEIVDSSQLDLRCLETLFLFEAEEGDVIWVDDRMATGYPARGSVPIVGIVEVLQALVGAGKLDPGEYYAKLERLRAANARFLPTQQDEILYHLRRAEARDTGVVESRPLRVLRRYVAACLARSDDVQRPPMPDGSPNPLGELEFVVGLNRAASGALVEVWKADEEEHKRRIRSEWLLANLYLDMPALAGLTWSQTAEQDDRYRLAVELAGLVVQAMQLDWRGSGGEPSPRREYLDWLHERVLRKRFGADPDLVPRVADSLKEYFTEMRENTERQEQAQAASLLLRLFLRDLPEPLQEELGTDADLAEIISIEHTTVTTIGDLPFVRDEFCRAASEAVNGREARIVRIDQDSEVTFAPLEGQDGEVGMRLILPDGDDTVVADDVLAVLSESVTEREAALRRNRPWFDCPDDEFERAVAEIASGESPQRRLDEAEGWRGSSAAVFYAKLHAQLSQYPALKLSELRPPSAEALIRHLRLRPDAGQDREFVDALDAAADELIREEGLFATIERLAGLPVPLPTSVIEAAAESDATERRSIFRRLLRAPGSPPSTVHTVRLLNRFSDDTQAYYRLARRIGTRLFGVREAEEFEAFAAVLKWVNDDFDRWPEARSWNASVRLAMVWAHAHRLFAILVATGAVASWIRGTFTRTGGQQMTSEVFERDPDYWLDVAHPRRIDRSSFLLVGLTYGFGDEAQRFGNEASLENTDGLAELSLLRDPTLARNNLGSFLGGDRGERLSSLLGSEQASLYSRQALRSLVENKLADLGKPDQEHLIWASIHAVIGDLPPYADLVDRLVEAVRQTDFVDLVRSNVQTGLLALHTAAQLAMNVGDEALRSRLKGQLVDVARILGEADSGPDGGRASVEELMERPELSPLLDGTLALAVAADSSERVHSEFAALIGELVSVWPSTVTLFKLTVLRLCEELPVSQSKHYWPLLIRLRAK